MSIIGDLRSNIDSILSIRDDLEAGLKPVYIVTRTWSGDEVGRGTPTDVDVRMLPTPRIVQFQNDHVIKEGGAVQQGDVQLKMISKQSYPTKELVDGTTADANKEVFYRLGSDLYRVINVKEKHLVWDVLLRKVTNQ